jgi:alpha-ribazole phosphatase
VTQTLPLIVWRHPRPEDAAGRCVGCTDLAVERRRARRLARRIQALARRQRWPHVVVTSPLRRCADVGRWLARWGWMHRVDSDLREVDFGDWDGRLWSEIGAAPVDAWCADFLHHAPGGGESLADFGERVSAWSPQAGEWAVVGHAGWLGVRGLQARGAWPVRHAEQWPRPISYGTASWRGGRPPTRSQLGGPAGWE